MAYKESITAVVVLFILGLVSIFSYLILSELFNAGFATLSLSTIGGVTDPFILDLPNYYLNALKIMDYVIVILMFVLIASIGIINTQVATSRVYAFVSFLVAPFVFLSGYILSYIFQRIASDGVFAGVIGYFSKTLFIMSNLHWIALVSICISMIAMYGKRDYGQYVEFGKNE